jgi:hypothetical protein
MIFIVLISLIISYLRIFYLFRIPPAKDKQAAAMQKAREARAEKRAALDSQTALKSSNIYSSQVSRDWGLLFPGSFMKGTLQQVQLGWEMKNAQSMTFSTDGTNHQNIDYISCHVQLLVEDHASPESGEKNYATWTFGIQSSHDGSSEEVITDWKNALNTAIEIFNDSPLGNHWGLF